jgi:hypothetical protein
MEMHRNLDVNGQAMEMYEEQMYRFRPCKCTGNWCKAPCYEDTRRRGSTGPRILNPDTRWCIVISFRLRPIYYRENGHRYSLGRMLDGLQRITEAEKRTEIDFEVSRIHRLSLTA